MSDRARRHALITSILAQGPVPSQEALVGALAAHGVKTTQTTLSRDLRDLGVVKTPAGYVLPTALVAQPEPTHTYDPGMPALANGVTVLTATGSLRRALAGHLLGVRPGVGMVVCKTAPGHAQVIALELDRTPPSGVIGTVGGDDTVFVAVDHPERVDTLVDELREMAGLGALETAGGGA